ncbi:MAG: response regulator [Candidatus Cloacimonetes bacterium]|nr:response regulator [Candidatus Cloacimonadota bacterium]
MSKRILIVEDEIIIAKDIELKLLSLGYEVIALCTSGDQAIEVTLSEKPDLILMDINLQGNLDGIQVAQFIQAKVLIPVIYLTSYSDDLTLQRAKITNPLGYIIKPFDERELHTSIELAFYKHDLDQRLLLSERKYRSLFENAQVGIIRCSYPEGIILEANHRFSEMLEYRFSDEKDMYNIFALVVEENDIQRIKTSLRKEGKLNQYEIKVRAGSGKDLWLEGSSWLRVDENIMENVFIDISERKKIEERLRQSQKMETVGQIAAGIAHEINTPLAVVSTRLQILLDDLNPEHEPNSVKQIEIINKNIYRISGIIEKLLGFSRISDSEKTLIDFNELINEVLFFVNPKSRKSGIEIELEQSPDLPGFWSNPNKFEQVFLNIIMNSFDAMPEGGKLKITTSVSRIDSTDYITISFSDTGLGMDKETQSRLFDPFYTTKSRGRGTGLGMYISYGIVKENNGELKVTSQVGKGTIINILLPVSNSNGDNI